MLQCVPCRAVVTMSEEPHVSPVLNLDTEPRIIVVISFVELLAERQAKTSKNGHRHTKKTDQAAFTAFRFSSA